MSLEGANSTFGLKLPLFYRVVSTRREQRRNCKQMQRMTEIQNNARFPLQESENMSKRYLIVKKVQKKLNFFH